MIVARHERDERALEAMFDACVGADCSLATRALAMGRDLFCSALRRCPMIGLYDGDKAIGAIVFEGDRAHIAVLPQHRRRWLTKAIGLAILRAWFANIELATTRVAIDNLVARRFIERVGFRLVLQQDGFATYEATRKDIRYAL